IPAVGALAVHAQLAFTDDALDMRERQPGKARLEEAVDPHVVLIIRHHHGLHLGRQRQFGLRLRWLLGRAARLVFSTPLPPVPVLRLPVLPRSVLPGLAALLGKTRRLAARPMTGGTLAVSDIALRARALCPIARGCGSLDAAAHGRSVAQNTGIVTAES